MTESAVSKKSPLHERHAALGAKFAEFGGWQMPLEYSGIVAEHTAVRTAAGMFDVSHLGKATVRGPGAATYVNSCLSNDLGRIRPGQAQYTLCCEADGPREGGVVDDLIAYLHADDDVFLIPNAANAAEVVRRLAAAAPAGIEVRNVHDDFAILAVQGGRSDEVVSAIGLPVGHDYMSFVVADYAGTPVVVCRTGYTGERGYELVVPTEAAVAVYDALLTAGEQYGLVPAGLGARDTLRTEMGYPLHGQDLSLDITPVQARSGWAVGWKKESFWGHRALRAEKEAGPARLLRGLRAVGRGIPRPHMAVTSATHTSATRTSATQTGPAEPGTTLGEVTSGTFSPTLRKGVALALLDAGVQEGDQVAVDVRGRPEFFDVVKPPFVTVNVRQG